MAKILFPVSRHQLNLVPLPPPRLLAVGAVPVRAAVSAVNANFRPFTSPLRWTEHETKRQELKANHKVACGCEALWSLFLLVFGHLLCSICP